MMSLLIETVQCAGLKGEEGSDGAVELHSDLGKASLCTRTATCTMEVG